MGFESLIDIEIFQGFFTLIRIAITITFGLIIMSKYYSNRRKEYFLIGLSSIIATSPWWGSSFSFLSIVFLDFEMGTFWFLFINNVFTPIAAVSWIYALSILICPTRKKMLVSLYSIICILFEILIITFLFIAPEMIGTKISALNSNIGVFSLLISIFFLLTIVITMSVFIWKSLQFEDQRIIWKARFLLLHIITFVVAAIMELLLPLTLLAITIVRLVQISGAIEGYLGWLLPEKISNWLIKEKKKIL